MEVSHMRLRHYWRLVTGVEDEFDAAGGPTVAEGVFLQVNEFTLRQPTGRCHIDLKAEGTGLQRAVGLLE
eukprot:gene9866-biopygen82